MSLLKNGQWVADQELSHTDTIITESTPMANRYHLYISLACPYAHRANLVVQFLGLPIDVSSVSPLKTDGWDFDEHYPDPLFGVGHLYELYQKHDRTFSGRATVPVLWDKEEHKIVSNSSADLALHLAEHWQDLAKSKHNLAPSPLKNDIIALNAWLNDHITVKVYHIGFAKTQSDYERHLFELFDDLATLNNRLASQKYLFGDDITLSDFFLFPTLVRFEKVYATLFKCSLKPLSEFKNLYRYLIDLYQIDRIQNTVDLEYIVQNYFYSFANVNPSRVVPKVAKLGWE
ncbi:glutathione S-transferase C-terminal domain-containing protein [Moraxella sp. ZY210820]|uniref:glutathione S-transferase C-terminal domain-containing protein n=1 Tax=unclassified Moraxella TaxID=2685852 RepID=UPI0027311EB9|nr:glutathione S-transferase C-terminal domain-containing protein [Moraxella sp. ZY210820]WLF83357.1 glutathione S-transferase C-terminal domain-containing protein [Moraxella sp. ZY210820]